MDKERVAIKRQVLLFCFARGKKPQAHYLRAEGKRLKLWREKDSIKIVLNRRQSMGTKGAAAEVFLTAFRTLAKKEQDIFLSAILRDKKLREDLIDIAIAESRIKDKSRPFIYFLKKHEN